MTTIAIAGGTGTVGRLVVAEATRRGHATVVLARSAGVDLRAGSTLLPALDGADAVIDVLSVGTRSAATSIEFFEATSSVLLAAEAALGIGHHVALSIVGVDGAPFDYYAGKVAQEALVAGGDVPWSILRATQFHEFAGQMLSAAKIGPLRLAPRMRTQPIDARVVAERLVDLAESSPSGRARDLAGPREESLPELMRAVASARGIRGRIPALSLPGAFGRAQRDGSLLPGPDAELVGPTFAQWLADTSTVH